MTLTTTSVGASVVHFEDAADGNATHTLRPAADCLFLMQTIVKNDSTANAVTVVVDSTAENIGGAATFVLESDQDSITLMAISRTTFKILMTSSKYDASTVQAALTTHAARTESAHGIGVSEGPILAAARAATATKLTLTTTKVSDGLFDLAAHYLLKFLSAGASAVNYLKITNTATGSSPIITAEGTDADLDLLLVSKGAGVVKLNGMDVATNLIAEAATRAAADAAYPTLAVAETNKDLSDPSNVFPTTLVDTASIQTVDRKTLTNSDFSDTGNTYRAASTSVIGAVELATDGENDAGDVPVASDQRLNFDGKFLTPVLADSLLPYAAALTSGTAYWIYLGKTKDARTSSFVSVWVTTQGLGAQQAEMAFASSTVPTGGNVTLTKIGASAFSGDLLTTGIKTQAITAAIPANTHLWLGFRCAMATTQPVLRGCVPDLGRGFAATTAASGVLTGAGPWTGVVVSGTQAVSNPLEFATLT